MPADLFLISNCSTTTYNEFVKSVDHYKTLWRGNTTLKVLPAAHARDTFAQVIALVEEHQPFHICSAIRYNDPHYRADVVEAARMDCEFGDVKMTYMGRGTNVIADLSSISGSPCIVKTSGSLSVRHKFVLHDLQKFLKKYKTIGPHYKTTLAFSPLDSIAGLETLLEAYAHRARLALCDNKLSPREIIDVISAQTVDYFQTTPSFMNLLRPELAACSHKLQPLRKIAFGSEPSLESTLRAYQERLPRAELMHTYGMTEVGILKTITDGERPWRLTLNREINPFRIEGGLLSVRSPCMMLGYLNHEGGADADGWFRTGDVVDDRDPHDFFRIIGRQDGTINVGGRKFFPTELEDIISRITAVKDVMAYSQRHPLIGNAVCVDIVLNENEEETNFRSYFKDFSESQLPSYMIPAVVRIFAADIFSERLKKMRPRL